MRKDFGMKLIVLLVVLAVAGAAYFVILPNLPQATTDLRLGDGIFKARIATSEKDRENGLSGVEKLAPDQALLMVFPNEDEWGIWMKDMKIPIDIVWLNADKKVIYIVHDATPEDSTLVTFEPNSPASYVVELPAGTVESKAITTASTAVFQVNAADIK